MPLELIFLGTGTSAGVPMIGCHCPVCRSDDPRDHRTRPSVLVRYPRPGGPQPADRDVDAPRLTHWLIDTTPEMRSQMIRHQIDHLDGVLYTHTHADHVFGLDDLRRFNAVMKTPLDIYGEHATLDRLKEMFFYIFEPHRNPNKSFVATLIPRLLESGTATDLLGATWTPLRLMHGRLPILGFRVDYLTDHHPWAGRGSRPSEAAQQEAASPSSAVPSTDDRPGSLAYCTDVSRIPPETYPLLEGLDVLVIDALRYRHHPTHLTVDQALEIIDQVKPRRAYLTHIAHDICHADLEARLPEHVFLAFDGLVLSC